MQGNSDDLNGEVAWREQRLDQIADEYRQLKAEIAQLRHGQPLPHRPDHLARMVAEQRAAEGKSVEQRRAEMRQKARDRGKRVLALIGLLLAWDWLKASPQRAAATMACASLAAVGTLAAIPDSADLNLVPNDPPVAVAPTPVKPDSRKSMPPTPLPNDDTPAPTISPPPGPGDPGAGPDVSADNTWAGAAPMSSPTEPATPAPSGTSDPAPPDEAEPSPTRPPTPEPTASPEPTVTITATPTASPSPTITATSPPPPAVPEECLLFAEIPALLEICLLDLEQGGGGRLLDGALGGRGLFG